MWKVQFQVITTFTSLLIFEEIFQQSWAQKNFIFETISIKLSTFYIVSLVDVYKLTKNIYGDICTDICKDIYGVIHKSTITFQLWRFICKERQI